MREYNMKCVMCNVGFISRSKSALYCVECKGKKRREDWEKRNEMLKAVKVEKVERPKFPSLTEIAKQAKAANMTYGQYVAMMEGS